MEQNGGVITKYGEFGPVVNEGYLIRAWAQKDERMPAFYGVARYVKKGAEEARAA